MFVQQNLGVNAEGRLTIAGVDTVELAERYGTPLIVMDERRIRDNCAAYREALRHHFGDRARAYYAGKAFSCKAMDVIVSEEGLGLDCASGGELYTAQAAGFPMDRVMFHSNFKTMAELELAVQYGVHRVVCDNQSELFMLEQAASRAGRPADILLRLTPGVAPHTHRKVQTALLDSKFGEGIPNGRALAFVSTALSCKNLRLRGVHCHIGSQIFESDSYIEAIRVMFGFMRSLRDELGVELPELNIGGGFGVPYVEGDARVDIMQKTGELKSLLSELCDEAGLPMPYFIMEPGRSIVADSAVTLYTIGSVKRIPGVRTYVSVDGGMTDNPRYALYRAKYDMHIADRAGKPRKMRATVAGKCCESGDMLGEYVKIQAAQPGDILAVATTGAYCYSMASNYNRIPRPAVIMVTGGEPRVIIRRETYEDIVRNDM